MTAGWTDALAPEQEPRTSEPLPRQPANVERGREGKYVKSAVSQETRRVRYAVKGTRNDTLNVASMALGQLVAGGVLDRGEAVEELTAAALAAGLSKAETVKTIASGMKKGEEDPRGVPPLANDGSDYLDDANYDELDSYEEAFDVVDQDLDALQQQIAGRKPLSLADVISQWSAEGPLTHEPTGISQLDEWTGGGPVYGTRWFVPGAPDAGKTLFLMQLAHVWLQRGVVVGILAIDEEPGDIVTRLAQRVGYARHHCETRDPSVMGELQRLIGELPFRLYDDRWTIEGAAVDLAAYAAGRRAALLIDSIQTAMCNKDIAAAQNGRELSEVTAVTARAQAIRAVATQHRLIAIATSEQGRGAYRSSDPSQQTTALASGKWSGAIEYGARVLLVLRSVPAQADLIEIEIAKNKHGPRDVKLHVRIDRSSQTLFETGYDPAPKPDRGTAQRDRCARDAVAVARVLLGQPTLGVNKLRAAVRSAAGIGNQRIEDALTLLGPALLRVAGPRNSQALSLDPSKLPSVIKQLLEAPE